MEAERVCVASVFVSRVLVVRRLRKGEPAFIIDIKEVAVAAAGLNADYPASDGTVIIGGGVGSYLPCAVLWICDAGGTYDCRVAG